MNADRPRRGARSVFRARHRISRDLDYRAAHRARLRKSAGPLVVFARPTDRPEARLGLSVGRRVGKAVRRHRIKRLLREAFRLDRARLPAPAGGAYDLVVSVRPHEPAGLDDYRRWLAEAARRADAEHRKRLRRLGDGGAPGPGVAGPARGGAS